MIDMEPGKSKYLNMGALALLLASCQAVQAKPVDLEQAKTLLAAFGGSDVVTMSGMTSQGKTPTLYYVAKVNGGKGFIAAPADDEMPPVIAFSPDCTFDNTKASLAKRLISKDMEYRLAALGKRGDLEEEARRSANAFAWAGILEEAGRAKELITDMRVNPLVAGRWAQKQVCGKDVYSRFTPQVNDSEGSGEMVSTPCGTLATAMAQLMRFHKWPISGIGVNTFSCKVDDEERELSTRGGDGYGGAYNWSQMPLVPSACVTDVQAEMIGSLCLDAGLSVNMKYTEVGSFGDALKAASALKNLFNYGQAVQDFDNNKSLTNKGDFFRKINANLDARLPVILGILGDSGYCVLCDGYGFSAEGNHYHHLNLGWGSSDSFWYNFANVGVKAFNNHYDTVSKLVYNITRSGTGECIGGRVFGNGRPVSGVQVQMEGTDRVATTDSNGVFGFSGIPKGNYRLKVTREGLIAPAINITVGSSVNKGATGNVWPVNITATLDNKFAITEQPRSLAVAKGESATLSVEVSGEGAFNYQWYQGMKSDDSRPLKDANANAYRTQTLEETARFWVRVSNGKESLDSETAVVTVENVSEGPEILLQPASMTIGSGETAWLSLAAKGKKLRYDWYRGQSGDTTCVEKENGDTVFVTPPLSATTSYWVRVTDMDGRSRDSRTSVITVE